MCASFGYPDYVGGLGIIRLLFALEYGFSIVSIPES